jgi:hypothetical protein
MKKDIFMPMIVFCLLAAAFVFFLYPHGQKLMLKQRAVDIALEIQTINGMVTRNDLSKSAITILTDEKGALTLTVGKSAFILKGGKYIKQANLKKGDIVKVAYQDVNGVDEVRSIVAQKKK